MADMAKTADRQQVQQSGWFVSTLTLPFRFLAVMFGSLFISVVFEWIGLYFFWGDQGWHHARVMLYTELDWLSEDFTRSVIVHEPGETAVWIIESAYKLFFVNTGFVSFVQDLSATYHNQSSSGHGWDQSIGHAMVLAEDYGLAAVYTILTFLVRLIVLTLTLPLFGMAVVIGFVDGLVRRDVRRFGAGLESGFLYHRARATIKPLAVAPWIVYLSLPISISPIFILLPCAIMLAISVSITAGSFKKYL
ncbi:TIGR03747 family integrating conjugative element membrane protein [Pseudomonas caricapapayae]|uniref:TIGR03747 family integrating conjugative element membrane protein n=1 Tax=Pseudomonas caricapapayae TaxID=46678 RepID=UPI000EFDBD7E|nr:TIGR03747 family integrating conjugative element membrane protein [Pseudomonas caricapapayae]